MQATHVAFADESRYTEGRYRALAVVSLTCADQTGFEAALSALLRSSSVRELSWKDVTDGRFTYAALKVLAWAVEQSARAPKGRRARPGPAPDSGIRAGNTGEGS